MVVVAGFGMTTGKGLLLQISVGGAVEGLGTAIDSRIVRVMGIFWLSQFRALAMLGV